MNDVKEIRKRIKDLNKLKKKMQVGSPARREILRTIRAEKEKLSNTVVLTTNKKELIAKILAIKPHLKEIGVDLEKFTEQELETHLNKITGKGGLNAQRICKNDAKR